MASGPKSSSTARSGGSSDDQSAVAGTEEGTVSGTSSSGPGRASSEPIRRQRYTGQGDATLTVDRVARFVLGAAIIAAAGWVLWYFAGIVLYLVVGGLLAYLLRPLVDYVQSLGLGRVPAILLVFVLGIGVVGVAVTSIVPFITRQVQDLSQLINVESAVYVANYIEKQVREVVPLEPGILEKNVRQVSQSLLQGDLMRGAQVAETVGSVVTVFTNIVYAVIIIPFVTFFLLKDELQIRQGLMSLVPNRYFEVTLAILAKVEVNIGRYFRALLIQGTAIAFISSALLWIVGLRGAIAIGIFTGLANTIPYFGPFLGFFGGALVGIAQTGDMSLVPGIALAMGLTQLADNILLQPVIFSRAAQTHPLVILFVVLVGAQLGGILGMLVAIPLTTTVRVIAGQLLWSLQNYRILDAG